MILHGKFDSLTLINWNGFFARTFELDSLVTTLSGGNGAGKSTTMAAFVTALIPDLTLLHFRNTTEAGATSGSRDRGLHGKLKPGVCYAILDVINSRDQRVVCGVRLQQIAGRDKKVDIKPFIIQGLDREIKPIELVTESVEYKKVRILALNEVKDRFEEGTTNLKLFNSIGDYHSMMFDLGVLPKRLRTPAERSKYYRLIEASLYGGISSAITRSLRDYLLPENTGVRKAFQDMELALRENRMTLEAIRVTQSDRDLFKHLIKESTDYVASDYMRHLNERRLNIETVVGLRRQLFSAQRQLLNTQYEQVELAKQLQEQKLVQPDLESELQSAQDHLTLIQTAYRQQEKINSYQDDIEELNEKMIEQSEMVEESSEKLAILKEEAEISEQEVDELKSQLADYQQALNVQQTRTIQYQKAVESLENARKLCHFGDLDIDNAAHYFEELDSQKDELTSQILELEQRLNITEAAEKQFETAHRLTEQLAEEPVKRSEAWGVAKKLLKEWSSKEYLAQQADTIQMQLRDLEYKLEDRKAAQKDLALLTQKLNRAIDYEMLDALKAELEALYESQEERATASNEQRIIAQQQVGQIQSQIEQLQRKAPQWLRAQESLQNLEKHADKSLSSSNEVTAYMQSLLEQERHLSVERDRMSARKDELVTKITQLSQPNGTDDARLSQIAESVNGVLLAEIYEDVTLEDAPYFSALYGPARQGIVVPDLDAVKEQLSQLEDCPEDIYFIEGDPSSFDDRVFESEELERAVWVRGGDRQWRYSQFPEIPLFGRAAREKQLDALTQERDQLNEKYALVSFNLQKTQRSAQYFNEFIALYLSIAFEENPEQAIQSLQQKRTECQRLLDNEQNSDRANQQQLNEIKDQLNLVNRLYSKIVLLADEALDDRVDEYREKAIVAQEAVAYVKATRRAAEELEPIVSALQFDPEQTESAKATYQDKLEQQKVLSQKLFSLSEVIQRKAHFSYSDSNEMANENGDLNLNLRTRLEKMEKRRNELRMQLQQEQKRQTDLNQNFIALKSAFDTKRDLLTDLQKELAQIGAQGDASSEERARQKRDEIQAQLSKNRELCSALDRQFVKSENEVNQLQKQVSQWLKEYRQLREQILQSNQSWKRVIQLVKSHQLEKRLHKRELAYMSAEALRSMSDKALGALRLAVADNEHLRDILRFSEDARASDKKVQFYIAVYQHLRERIRQDILKTDDPIEAIEQMEIELSRLTEELTSRELQLAISSKSVANIIKKTIQREQNRIRMLNQGLQAVSFGQVNGVRLNVNIREAHTILLNVLAEQREEHEDLFKNSSLTFSEALAKLFQRLHPQVDFGQRTAQTIGEELLDYRNYLDLDIEVNRGADGWLRAESGALSTGEAIGTGMSILLMVIQSWEEESKRLRSKDIEPCRLLFLDEAARLDAKSIATLFELCEKLSMQLIIAAPENINPEKGTTYKLIRKVHNNQEHVHVVGLKGFA